MDLFKLINVFMENWRKLSQNYHQILLLNNSSRLLPILNLDMSTVANSMSVKNKNKKQKKTNDKQCRS